MMVEVGDRVQVVAKHSAFFGDKGTVIENDGTDNIPFHVNIDDSGHVCWFDEEDLKVLDEVFKVGDRVKIIADWSDNIGKSGEIKGLYRDMFDVSFDNGGSSIYDDYDLSHETEKEEASMKFKVGDKVKVSNSWEGRSGEVGEIIGADDGYKFKYTVAFYDGFAESFREDELEIVKEKDNYPTLKQEYRSLLEIQTELTTLEESMMCKIRHTRTEIARNAEELAELESKILEAARQ